VKDQKVTFLFLLQLYWFPVDGSHNVTRQVVGQHLGPIFVNNGAVSEGSQCKLVPVSQGVKGQ
jgi:hypothetical protein